MKITKTGTLPELTVAVEGRLDTSTAPQLEKELYLAGVTKLVFDFADIEYVSSAGLRVLLSAQKKMNKQGEMIVRNVNETVAEVFEITGFSDILNIE
ncbi:MAG: STAS domain-containing protein [Gracilibacteraceae bacterium]|jgi:anti-sigma B factor antagonist|nr:STAS domain-containing protein [Gracilibacteraceae bacterium]